MPTIPPPTAVSLAANAPAAINAPALIALRGQTIGAIKPAVTPMSVPESPHSSRSSGGEVKYVIPLYLGTPDPGSTVQTETLEVLRRHLGVGYRLFAYGVAPPEDGGVTRQVFLHGILQIVDHAGNGHTVLASNECDIQQGTVFTKAELLAPNGPPRFASDVKGAPKACA